VLSVVLVCGVYRKTTAGPDCCFLNNKLSKAS